MIANHARNRAVFEGEVQNTISIYCHLLHHGIPQRRRKLDHLLIAVHQLFCKGREHFALWDTAGSFGLDGLIPISGILITLCQRIVSGGVFFLIHCHAGVLRNGLFHQLRHNLHFTAQLGSLGFQGLCVREEIYDDLDVILTIIILTVMKIQTA